MTKLSALDALIPHAAPTEPVARTLLVAIRRLATGGLNDAHASNLLISNFGMHYRRPLLFLRIFLEEISRISRRQIAIAPCCCPRMTAGEVAFLEVVARARVEPDTARATQLHPFVRPHPETGQPGLFSCLGYIIGFQGMDDAEAMPLLGELYQWQSQERFQYRHRWRKGMLVMWDNRSLLHAATGGYAGHARLLHRTTIAAA